MLDNAATFRDFQPLSAEENAVIQTVREILESKTAVACTGCAYCTNSCPKNIAIPQYFALLNSAAHTTGSFSSQNVILQ